MQLLRTISSSNTLKKTQLWIYKNVGIYFKVKRFLPSTLEQLRTVLLCKHYGIQHVFDIGANKGQFAEYLFSLGYEGGIISFEPTLNAYEVLKTKAEKNKNWIVPDSMAIGAADTSIQFHEYKDSVFNSVLEIDAKFAKDKAYLEKISTREVPMKKLDTIASNFFDIKTQNFLLKIDTQGFEKEVLEGAKETLKFASMIKIEVPIKPIYENINWTFYEIIDFMKSINFHPVNFDIEGVNENGLVRTIDFTFLNLNKHEL